MLKNEIPMNQIKISVQIFICKLNQVVKDYSGWEMYHYIQITKKKTKKKNKQNGPAGKGMKEKANSGKENELKQRLPVPSLMLLAFSSTSLFYRFCSLISPSSHSLRSLLKTVLASATLWNTREVTRNKWPQETKLLLHRFQSKRDNDWQEWNY